MSAAMVSIRWPAGRLVHGTLRAMLALGCVLILGDAARGQGAPNLEFAGAIDAVAPGSIAAKSPAGETWMLQIPPDAKVQVTGTADPEMLQAGRLIRLTATVDRRGSVRDPVRQITLIEAADRPGRRPGAFSPGQYEAPAPGERVAEHGGPMPLMAPAMPDGAEEMFLELRGWIRSNRRGYLTVEIPSPLFKAPVRLELAEPLDIAVESSDYRLAKPGDHVSARGPQIGQNAILGREVTIALSNPIGETRKRPAAAPPASDRPPPEARDAFEVAPPEPQAAEDDGPREAMAPGGGAQPVHPEPAAPAAEPPREEETAELLGLLAPRPDAEVPPNIRVRLNAAPPATFTPCRPIPASDLRRRFGPPDQWFDLRGELPVGKERGRQAIRWEMWVYGEVKLLVDETGMARYRKL